MLSNFDEEQFLKDRSLLLKRIKKQKQAKILFCILYFILGSLTGYILAKITI